MKYGELHRIIIQNVPFHGSKEIDNIMVKIILKDMGIKR